MLPDGTEIVKNGRVFIKVAGRWVRNMRVAWDAYHPDDPVKAGEVLLVVDRDQRNTAEDNIIKVPRRIMIMVRKSLAPGDTSDVVRVKVALARLRVATLDREIDVGDSYYGPNGKPVSASIRKKRYRERSLDPAYVAVRRERMRRAQRAMRERILQDPERLEQVRRKHREESERRRQAMLADPVKHAEHLARRRTQYERRKAERPDMLEHANALRRAREVARRGG